MQPPIFPFLCLFGACTFGNIFWQDSPNWIQDKDQNKPMWQSHLFIFKRLQTKLASFFICNTLYATPGWDLIQSILFINEKQCFASFLQEKSRGGGRMGASHYKWCANDILKITLILKIMLLLPSINKNFHFPLCVTSSFWHFDIPLFIDCFVSLP